jgi:hypothetical protein
MVPPANQRFHLSKMLNVGFRHYYELPTIFGKVRSSR